MSYIQSVRGAEAVLNSLVVLQKCDEVDRTQYLIVLENVELD